MARVAVIGAGMAGLAAAYTLRSKMRDLGITLFEANDRIGGRAWTETIEDEPIDWGCEALEGKDTSHTTVLLKPFGEAWAGPDERMPNFVMQGGEIDAAELEREISRSPASTKMDDNVTTSTELYNKNTKGKKPGRKDTTLYGAEDDSPTHGADISPGPGRIAALVSQNGGSFAESCILGESSAYDRARAGALQELLQGNDVDSPFFTGGLGAAVSSWANEKVLGKSGLTLKLNWPVSEVRNTTDGVEVVHNNGIAVMKFDAAIITVPTPVIASGKLKVVGMSKEQLAAFRDCPLGHYHKLAVTGVGAVAGLNDDERVYVCNSKLEYAFFITASPSGGYFMAHVAGEAGKRCNEDERWAENTFIELLEVLKGSKIARSGLQFRHSNWHSDPYIGGAYSYSKAGKGGARQVLSELKLGNIHFAGEAYSLVWYGSLEGAAATGVAAAQQVIDELDA